MAKGNSLGDTQDRILKRFENTTKNHKDTVASLSIEQQLKDLEKKQEERKRKKELDKIKKEQELNNAPTYISTYDINNPLNGFSSKSRTEQDKIKKIIKDNNKEKKSNI